MFRTGIIFITLLPPFSYAAGPGDLLNPVSRGQLLYQNHCTVCHQSNVHIRNKRKARTIADINQWTGKWATHLKLEWSARELSEVTNYLNHTYYKYSR